MFRQILAIVLLLTAANAEASPSAQDHKIASAFSTTRARLNRRCDWQFCRNPLMRRLWQLAGEWVVSRMDRDPVTTAQDVEHALQELDRTTTHAGLPSINVSAMELQPGDFLITASYFETGTFFVLGRAQDGHAHVKWSVDAYAATADGAKLRCWRAGADCGPLYGTAHRLPSGPDGARFYLEAFTAGNGMTVGGETSIWSWNGNAARLLAMAGPYEVMIDDSRHTAFDGEMLTIPMKELSTLSVAGSDPDPAGSWTIRITPAGAEDLGHRWLSPELQWFDELVSALRDGKDAGELAAPSVINQLSGRSEDIGGMLMGWSASASTPETFCIETIEDVHLTFTLIDRGDHLFATELREP